MHLIAAVVHYCYLWNACLAAFVMSGYRFCKVSIYANLQYVVVVPLVEYSMCCNVVVFERLYATVCVVWFKDL